jgi:hypothetical protein
MQKKTFVYSMPYLEDEIAEDEAATAGDEPCRADPACNSVGVKALCATYGVPFDAESAAARQFTFLMFCAFVAVVRTKVPP